MARVAGVEIPNNKLLLIDIRYDRQPFSGVAKVITPSVIDFHRPEIFDVASPVQGSPGLDGIADRTSDGAKLPHRNLSPSNVQVIQCHPPFWRHKARNDHQFDEP